MFVNRSAVKKAFIGKRMPYGLVNNINNLVVFIVEEAVKEHTGVIKTAILQEAGRRIPILGKHLLKAIELRKQQGQEDQPGLGTLAKEVALQEAGIKQ